MNILSRIDESSLEKLIKPIYSSIATIMFVEAGANTLMSLSDKASRLLQELLPFIEDRLVDVEIGNHKNIRYFFRFNDSTFKILLKYGANTEEWKFPDLFESLSFLRKNGHSVLFINFAGVARYYVDEIESLSLRNEFGVTNDDFVSFETFLADPNNERDDYYSWITAMNYPKESQ